MIKNWRHTKKSTSKKLILKIGPCLSPSKKGNSSWLVGESRRVQLPPNPRQSHLMRTSLSTIPIARSSSIIWLVRRKVQRANPVAKTQLVSTKYYQTACCLPTMCTLHLPCLGALLQSRVKGTDWAATSLASQSNQKSETRAHQHESAHCVRCQRLLGRRDSSHFPSSWCPAKCSSTCRYKRKTIKLRT